MKYIKADAKDDHMRIIAGEMINIMQGYTHYINGQLQAKPKKTNQYVIKSVSYTIYPNIGVVYMTDLLVNPNTVIQMLTNMLREASISQTKLVSLLGTTQYINITLENPTSYIIDVVVDGNILKLPNGSTLLDEYI
jgi:hypothetical protein